jgi:phosphoserine aminotransferase
MFNTPPVLPVFAALQTLRWLKDNGGIEAMHKTNVEKAGLLYNEIDRNSLFRATVESDEDRSLMNICFVMKDGFQELEKPFFDFASQRGMIGIKGHRSVGGFRASTYNALPVESVKALVETMQEFEKTNA